MRKACRDQQGRGETWLVFVRVPFGDFDHAATAPSITALLLLLVLLALLLLPRLGFCCILLMLSVIEEEAARHKLFDGEHFYI